MTTHEEGVRRPLDGIRVLDCGTIIAAPYCAALLADWGADVIKIEHPNGDNTRHSGPNKDGVGLVYKFYGRNKRNVVINFSTAEGQDLMRGLVAKSDVVIENFRPGVMERWNLGWDHLHALNPQMVMLRVTGFGQTGPYSARAGFGTLAESMSGYAHINGYPDGPPTLPPFGLADGIAAFASAYAIMLALYQRDAKGGSGQMIDTALIEPIFHILGAQTTIFDQLGVIQNRSGNRSVNVSPRNTYRTRDERWVAISTASQSVAERVLHMVGRPDITTQPWFATGRERAKHADELDEAVGSWIAARDHDDVLLAFEQAGAAVAPIYNIEQLLKDPQYKARGSVVTVPDEELGQVQMQNLPFRMSASQGEVRHAGRRQGRDTEEVLRELLGLDEAKLKELRDKGVTRAQSVG
jgi:crotonobetainyl-CoA:carnitine CoA-transferase CaiB-like acyl-CoA transferase